MNHNQSLLPKWSRRILKRLLPTEEYEYFSGDLEEGLNLDLVQRSRLRARIKLHIRLLAIIFPII